MAINQSKTKRIFFFSFDGKVEEWKRHLPGSDVEFLQSPRSMVMLPFWVMRNWNKAPNAVVIRYLNQKYSFHQEVISTLKLLFALLFFRVLFIKIGWICHNVDRETKTYFPNLMKIKRTALKFSASHIFVTDVLLVEKLIKFVGISKNKISICTFGAFGSTKTIHKHFKLSEGKPAIKKLVHGLMTGVCANGGGPKRIRGAELILEMSYESLREKIPLQFLITGGQVLYIKNNNLNLYRKLSAQPNIELIEGNISLECLKEINFFDFSIKCYTDYSVPLGLYHSISLCKPIMAENGTFVSEMVEYYSLGSTVESDCSNLKEAIEKLKEFDYKKREAFMTRNSWERGALALKKLV
ncbi:MAG: glycosyltransferase [Salinarimonas sp.]|nr:glycosyltransferase [Salinarimonas sp.]